MDKLIKKDKKKIDKMMTTLIKKDIPRDEKIEKYEKGKKAMKGKC
jgi:hemerythrin superfamily protein